MWNFRRFFDRKKGIRTLYKCMKVFFLFPLLFLIPLMPASSFSFSVCSDGTVGMRGDGVNAAISGEEISLELPLFSFGAMEKGGIIYSLDHPFSSSSLSPSFSGAGSKSGTVGTCFSYSSFSFFSFYGEREGAGVVFENDEWTAGLVYAAEEDDGSYQKDVRLRTDRSTFWLFGDYESSFFSARVMSSFSLRGAFSSLFCTSLAVRCLTLTYGRGTVQAFSRRADGWYSFFSASLEGDSFSVSHELRYSPDPVFIREYRDYEYRINGKLNLGDFTLSDAVTKTFSGGKTERGEKIELEWMGLTLGWNTEKDSIYALISRGGAFVKWESGKLSVSVERTIASASSSFTFSLSSSGTSSWVYTYTY